jgi:hypothetical protein
MVKLTLGEQPAPTQSVKPFPKLMSYGMTDVSGAIILALSKSGNDISGIVLHSTIECYPAGYLHHQWNARTFTDYNEPITIQNA